MAVNESRSMNGELKEGITDGIVKKLAPNRSGTPNDFGLVQSVYDTLAVDLYGVEFSDGVKNAVAKRYTTVRG